jgi:hypothetical protein
MTVRNGLSHNDVPFLFLTKQLSLAIFFSIRSPRDAPEASVAAAEAVLSA